MRKALSIRPAAVWQGRGTWSQWLLLLPCCFPCSMLGFCLKGSGFRFLCSFRFRGLGDLPHSRHTDEWVFVGVQGSCQEDIGSIGA